MLRKEKEGATFLEFELLQDFPNLRHGVFTKHGGVSSGAFASLNVGCNIGDSHERVQANRERALKALSPNSNENISLVSLDQVHKDTVCAIDRPPKPGEKFTATDGAMTTQKKIALMIIHADCQAAIFYDTKNKAVAIVHAGWRGSVSNIYKKTVEGMQKKYLTKPEELIVCISPSLGPEKAEFINYKTELPEEFWQFQVKPTYFDFWAISEWQLKNLKILPQHIEVARICTFTSAEDFFSYRRDKTTERNATLVYLD
jgi:polyphenol oxidase